MKNQNMIFVELDPAQTEQIQPGKYEVARTPGRLCLVELPEKQPPIIDPEVNEKTKHIRSWLRSDAGERAAREILGKTGNQISLRDASNFAVLSFGFGGG
jgi:hypothetical protein